MLLEEVAVIRRNAQQCDQKSLNSIRIREADYNRFVSENEARKAEGNNLIKDSLFLQSQESHSPAALESDQRWLRNIRQPIQHLIQVTNRFSNADN